MATPLLEVRDLVTVFPSDGREVRAVDRVSFSMQAGHILGLVGESGCGKSMTALSILRLVPPPGRVAEGKVLLEGRDLLALSEDGMRAVRGDRISMVFQEPMSALNPVFTIGDQVAEVLRIHRGMDRAAALERVVDLLARVGMPDPRRRAGDYPHQLSGGMQQRALIAMALACEPAVLLADEPTTALDVTVQAQILTLLNQLVRTSSRACLLITHDLGVVAEIADRVCVMYAGSIMEESPVGDLFDDPRHPYAIALLDSVPVTGRRSFRSIPGTVPDLAALPRACRFAPRCPKAQMICREVEPRLAEEPGRGGRLVRCYFPGR